MRVLFRVDASLEIGSGHVVRCLTLAQALHKLGMTCEFVCRQHVGHLIENIAQQGFVVHALPKGRQGTWLGATWQEDVRQTLESVGSQRYDWLIVDHYGLDADWEKSLRCVAKKLLAIDDLANRTHDADLVWDQNLGRELSDYVPWVRPSCEVHVGAMCALLRPDFFMLRAASRDRRSRKSILRLMVAMGGVDKDNVTEKVLKSLQKMPDVLPSACKISVVMGHHAPWLQSVRAVSQSMPWKTEVCVGVTNMAELMTQADLAIAAVGTSAWERCCLGLPTLAVILADNQQEGAKHLDLAGAVCLLPDHESMAHVLREKLLQLQGSDLLLTMQDACYRVTDGRGTQRLARRLRVPWVNSNEGAVRTMSEDDLLTVLSWRNHPSVKRFMLTSTDISQEEHRSWFQRVSQDNTRAMLLYVKEDQSLGFVQFSGIYDACGTEWGFYVSPNAPKGTGFALGQAAIRFAFTQLAVDKIIGNVMEHNVASLRFHEKLGFAQNPNKNNSSHMLSFELTFEVWLQCLEMQHQEVVQ